ncbi:IS5/IS1182 family transposase IS4811 [Nonomuraea aridisoli]|uniref:IS5/IS1182 family transposase IS4811 n=1 Tax=Nonomuraea aridisoli TaxID=2070368 RepID=A0A2W2G4N9_9ACTN|nr:IS5 family transposase [Nonomuraea aridisoli]PZG21844.1 IS5/IS1182 family transposase IS4811 [Nonomuraea aridisoli]
MRRRRYPSDTTTAEWALIEPLLPPPACQSPYGGRPEVHPRREIVDAIRYVCDNGIKWRALPSDFPPWSTCYKWFAKWARTGLLARVRDALVEQIRQRAGRCARPVTIIVDSQSVKAAETVAKADRGYDPAKKINGTKRHIAVDTRGLLLNAIVTAADLPDRAVARDMLTRLRLLHPQITLVWADSAYGGELVEWARTRLCLTLKIVSQPRDQPGFVVLPRRWIVERTLSWIMRARRNCRDYERLASHSEAFLNWTAITLMTRRLTRKRPSRTQSPAALAA